ncbi:hypothetical protein M501DRAFT_1005868 [Patellaria atrata CBS 101060]|uniref:Uncharacterized protein n=1 Tax=Patellaria atrata CBS 101060 TaxID=1346257 RepID=A0A9P4VTK6_9PEZI|nr:hypothetical protein M501DRAFT_1005868 [Patellaria atrata CBS 101060]
MAPLPDYILSLLPRKLDLRAISSHVSDLLTSSLKSDEHTSLDKRDDGLSPMSVHDLHTLQARAYKQPPGGGAKSPTSFNNQVFFALFAIIGAGMVLTSLWFFFWAKNGGFKFKEGDWDDYKSTVLRRKGPDGKTLSNATKSTKLGGGSVVHGGSYQPTEGYTDTSGYTDKDEMRDVEAGHGIRGGGTRRDRRRERERDPELREYRHERPAKVGGMNREADGSHFDYTNTEPSEVNTDLSQQPLTSSGRDRKREKQEREERRQQEKLERKAAAEAAKRSKAEAKAAAKAIAAQERTKAKGRGKSSKDTSAPSIVSSMPYEPAPIHSRENTPKRSAPSAAYSFTTGDDSVPDTATVYTSPYTTANTVPYSDYTSPTNGASDSYYSSYRPAATAPAPRTSTGSPSKPHHRSSRPASEASYSALGSAAGSAVRSDLGTKVYSHYIPGLSKGEVQVYDSVSQVGSGERREERKGRDVMEGYRRGGRVRRDSLSDSE